MDQRRGVDLHFEGKICTKGAACCNMNVSPTQFYARIENDLIFDNQISLLNLHNWSIDRLSFLQYVKPSSLEKRVWLDTRYLARNHDVNIRVFINLSQLKSVLDRSLLNTQTIKTFEGVNEMFSKLSYPTLNLDFFPLIYEVCGRTKVNNLFKRNTIYFLSTQPNFILA